MIDPDVLEISSDAAEAARLQAALEAVTPPTRTAAATTMTPIHLNAATA